MPNRIIKESICTSEEIDSLTPEQEVFFYRLMVNVDDYGLLDARQKILASKCFPLKSIDTKKIEAWLQALASVDLIKRYEVDGLPYLAITKWAQHQQIRAKRPKYPAPESGSEIICNQVQANVPVIQFNPIQSESNLNPNTKARRTAKPFSGYSPEFEKAWAEYPKRPGASKADSFKAWSARIKAGAEAVSMIAGVSRYAAYCAKMGTEPNFIKQPATFFGPGKHYESDWTVSVGRAGPARASPMNSIGVDDKTPEGFSDGFR